MGLETGTYIDYLVASNPTAGDDVSAGDDHLRLIKTVILNTFPNIQGEMSASHQELLEIGHFVVRVFFLSKFALCSPPQRRRPVQISTWRVSVW